MRRVLSLSFAALLFLPTQMAAQTAATGSVTGTVQDASGAVIPGAKVKLLQLATNQSRSQTTNEAGNYTFPSVPPGVYKLTVSVSGFQTAVVPSIQVQVAKSFNVDVTLQVGPVAQTVEVPAERGAELQTLDATVGNVLASELLLRLPSLQRNAVEFLTLQPATIPESGLGEFRSGAVAGARGDQSTLTLDGVDITDNFFGGGAPEGRPGGLTTIVPVPVESVEEFRVGVSNPNASFGRSAGGQVALVGRRGSNDIHGAVWEFHQNDNLNANSWSNNRAGITKAEQKDNRYGARLGGPILRNKTFFFGMFEGRSFQQAFDRARVVPTASLRRGVLRFRDAAGNIVNWDLATSRLCGPANSLPCDPRSLGLSPSVQSLWSLLPAGNDPTLGDGLNTIGFRTSVSAPLRSRYGVLRLDHNLTKEGQWRLQGSGTYVRDLATAASQLDIRGSQAVFTGQGPQRGQNVTLGLTGTPSPNLIQSFRFGWTRNRVGYLPMAPSQAASLLKIPGTDTSAGFVAISAASVNQPIDIETIPARILYYDDQVHQFADDLTWVKGNHTLQFGADLRLFHFLHTRSDKGIGASTSLQADLAKGGFINIPGTSRPPVCAAPGQSNCINAADVSQWDQLFAATTGMMDNVRVLLTRDGDLNPLPLGSPMELDTTLRFYEFYFQDMWRLKPSLTLALGLRYGWTTPPHEKLLRQTFLTNVDTGEFITFQEFMAAKRQAALKGGIFNPKLGFTPIRTSGRDGIYNIDRGLWAPRVSAAWSPSLEHGLLGRLVGKRKTVLRGGFSITYDRPNLFGALYSSVGVGFSQTLTLNAPRCNASGAGGSGCNPAGTDPLGAFRVGVDGTIPLPKVPAISSPIVPDLGFSDLLSLTADLDSKVGRSYGINFTIQRELPANLLLELGYLGRAGRRLPTNTNLNSAPIFQLDPASGQTFAQAFDAVANQLRAGVPAANVTPQPFFQNQMPGGTARIVAANSSDFISGSVSTLFRTINVARLGAGLAPFTNLQVLELWVRASLGWSNYHAGFVTLRKRLSQGLTFDLNYTFSKSLDQQGVIQRSPSLLDNSFLPGFEYGPSLFDRTHVLNASFLYDLPAGRGHRLRTGNWADHVLGGWQVGGIFRAASGVPVWVTQGVPALGGGALLLEIGDSAAIPTVDIDSLGAGVHSGVAGSNNIGTSGDPAQGGTGLNMFADPAAAFNSFRKIRLSQDGRGGRANPFRSFPEWNLDLSLNKRIPVRERVAIRFSADFFNLFNHITFAPPALNLTNPRAFGVVNSALSPVRRPQSGSRWIQLGLRIEF